ncbi:MAG: tetratricopeptide repeat protein [Myxococcota bacterium]
MRLAFALVLAAAPAFAAPARPAVVALLPPKADPALQPLAELMVARASELVEVGNSASEVHPKQVWRALQEEDLTTTDFTTDANLEQARRLLGADRALGFSLSASGEELTLTGLVRDEKKATPFSVKAGKGWSKALDTGAAGLAKALLGAAPPKPKVAVQPASANPDALAAAGRCAREVQEQPLGVENPVVLEAADLEAAVADCQKALSLDPSLRYASAALALGQSLLGRNDDAAKTLATLGDADDVLELYSLARFWMLTRFQSNEAGVAFLRDVVKKHPGELIARAYLGETLGILGEWKDAEAVWREYLVRAPSSPFALARLSKALARQGKHEEAIATAKKGLELAPSSRELRLEVASRLIDANSVPEAKATLAPLATSDAAHGEDLLRLGWAHWLSGETEAAQQTFERALSKATAPGEWRTRGRAQYDLALVAMAKGDRPKALKALKASMQTGFRMKTVDPSLKDVVQELERADVGVGPADAGTKLAGASLTPREASLFPTDAFGDPNPKATKPQPPSGLVLYRF